MGTSWNRIGVLILLVLCSSYGVTVKTDSLQVRQNAQVDGKLKVGNTPKPISTDSVLTKFPDGTIGLWPISAISTDTSFTDSSLWADSSRASYKSDTTAGALRLGGKTLSQIDTIGHGAIKKSIRDTASNKLWIHGKADSCVLADSVKKIPPVAFSDSSRAAYKADTSAGALRLGGKTKAYYDTVGAGWIRDSLANKLCLHCVADSAGGAARLGGKTLSQIDTIGHGAIKKSIRDTASNKLWVHGTADSANGSKYLGGKTKAYYDTVGNGGMNAAIALKLNISDTSIFSRDGHGHDTGDLSGLPNFNYFVQGDNSTRTTDAGTTDVNSYSKSGFYKATTNAANTPTAGAGYGIIHTNYHTGNQYAFQLASQWSANRLFYRVENDGTWMPWVELWHAGNFDPSTKQPADATLTALAGLNTTAGFLYQTGTDAFTKYPFGTAANTVCQGNDSRLSDARVPINNDYYVQGSSSTRTTDADRTDVNSFSQSGFYRALSAAPNLPTAFGGYGIIHTNYTSNLYAFQLASQWSANRLFYRVENDGTWMPWVELYHSGNLNPADYTLTTDPRLSDARTPTAHAATHLYGGSDAITGEWGFGLRSVSISDAWSVGGALENGGIGVISDSGRLRQAITFTDVDADSHPVFSIITSKNYGSTWTNVFNVTSSGSGIFKGDITAASMHVGDKLTLAVDGSGHATVSTKEYGDDIKIKTGGNGSEIDMKDLSTSISSRDVTVSSSYQTKVKSSGTVQIEGGSGITLDCTGSNSLITANKRMTVKRLNYGEKQNIYLTEVNNVHWIDADTLTSSYLNIELIHDSLAQYGRGEFGIKNAKIGDVFIIEMDNYSANMRFWWKYDISWPPATPAIPFWHKNTWISVMAICRRQEAGPTGQGDYGSEFIVFVTTDGAYN